MKEDGYTKRIKGNPSNPSHHPKGAFFLTPIQNLTLGCRGVSP